MDFDVEEVLQLDWAIRAIKFDSQDEFVDLLLEKIFPINNHYDTIKATDLFVNLDPKYSKFGWFKFDIATRLLRSWPEPITMDENDGKWEIYRFPLARFLGKEVNDNA